MRRTIARMITLLARKSQGCIGNALRKYHITAAEQPFFMALQRSEGITQEELTALVCVDKAATTRAVQSLERKGLLLRVQDEQDRRQNRLYPTEKAREMGEAVSEELLRFNARLTRGIDPDRLEVVYEALVKMEENLSALSGEQWETVEGGTTDAARP